jgi:hypothetical protein
MSRYFRQGIILGVALLAGGTAQAQTRPPIGGIGQAPDAMIFYVAHGGPDACGPGCSAWIAAEGAVQFDTFKRLIAILDRQSGHRLPVVINSRGLSNLNVAASLGRILRDRGIDVTVGMTVVEACNGKPEADCFALKRPGGPLDAQARQSDIVCDLACVMMLAGGVHRSLPPGSHVVVTSMSIHNRLAPNVSAEARETLSVKFADQFRKYLTEMGVEPALIDIADSNVASGHAVEIPSSEWNRLHLITPSL